MELRESDLSPETRTSQRRKSNSFQQSWTEEENWWGHRVPRGRIQPPSRSSGQGPEVQGKWSFCSMLMPHSVLIPKMAHSCACSLSLSLWEGRKWWRSYKEISQASDLWSRFSISDLLIFLCPWGPHHIFVKRPVNLKTKCHITFQSQVSRSGSPKSKSTEFPALLHKAPMIIPEGILAQVHPIHRHMSGVRWDDLLMSNL